MMINIILTVGHLNQYLTSRLFSCSKSVFDEASKSYNQKYLINMDTQWTFHIIIQISLLTEIIVVPPNNKSVETYFGETF